MLMQTDGTSSRMRHKKEIQWCINTLTVTTPQNQISEDVNGRLMIECSYRNLKVYTKPMKNGYQIVFSIEWSECLIFLYNESLFFIFFFTFFITPIISIFMNNVPWTQDIPDLVDDWFIMAWSNASKAHYKVHIIRRYQIELSNLLTKQRRSCIEMVGLRIISWWSLIYNLI